MRKSNCLIFAKYGINKIFAVFLLAAVLALFFWQGIYSPISGVEKKQIFLVKKGAGSEEIASDLEDEKLIKSKNLFRIYVLIRGISNKLQAGTYLFSPSMNVLEIAAKMVSGETEKETITIPEGFTLKQIEQRLKGTNIFIPEFKGLDKWTAEDFQEQFAILKNIPGDARLEGLLFPDTYQFSYGTGSGEVINKMLFNFDKKFNIELRDKVAKQGKTIYDIIIVASLLEKEVRTLEDKKIVSGILWKRLELGIPLQVDASIAYITGKKTTKISTEETKIDSPYNTYIRLGLPVAPICNPGTESILAAVEPIFGEYLYYLSSPAGETFFSRTLEGHNIKKAKYLK